jgi:ribosome recycling factor
MSVKEIMDEHEYKMEKAMEVLHGELRAVRTGRASTGLVETIRVEYYGTATPLKQIAALATPQADTIIIKPFDPSIVKEIEKAIKNSDLSIAPVIDGKLIRLTVPTLSNERRKQLVHQVKQLGEQTKISMRNIRRDGIKELEKEEKEKTITEDDLDNGKKQMDELTKNYTDKIDEMAAAKSDEILSE